MKNVIVDIDGTLADCEHRLHHILVGEKDWPAFDAGIPDDTPIENMIEMVRIFDGIDLNIILLTGRNERTRDATIEWLEQHGVPFHMLEMRDYHDHRPAVEIKVERLKELKIHPAHVLSIFEDEPKTVRALRDLGFHVCDVLEWKDGYAESLEQGGRND